jgi:hypothetical protein
MRNNIDKRQPGNNGKRIRIRTRVLLDSTIRNGVARANHQEKKQKRRKRRRRKEEKPTPIAKAVRVHGPHTSREEKP